MTKRTWTDERCAELARLVDAEMTVTEIAEAMGATKGTITVRMSLLGLYSKSPRKKKCAWTDEKIAELKRLVAAGESYNRIAEALGINRWSVTHKAKALRLVHPHGYNAPNRSRARRASTTSPEQRQAQILSMEATRRIRDAVLEVRESRCKYPVGDLESEGFHFCGEQAPHGSYCDKHAALCREASKPRPRVKTREAQSPRIAMGW